MIPGPVIGILSELLPHLYSRETINEIFLSAGASGRPPRNWEKAGRIQNWCLQINALEPEKAERILSRLVERLYTTPPYRNKEHLVEPVAEQITEACNEEKFKLRISPRQKARREQLVFELHGSEKRSGPSQKKINQSLRATIDGLDSLLNDILSPDFNQRTQRNYQLTDEEVGFHQLLQ